MYRASQKYSTVGESSTKKGEEHISNIYDKIFERLDENQSGRIFVEELVEKFDKFPSNQGRA